MKTVGVNKGSLWGQVCFSSLLLSSLELSDAQVYPPQIRALLGTASQVCKDFRVYYAKAALGPDPNDYLIDQYTRPPYTLQAE